MSKQNEQDTDWRAVIGRALCYLCLHESGLKEDDLTTQAKLMDRFGLPRAEVARLLGTSAESLRVTLARASKKKGKGHGKKKAAKSA